MPTTINRVFHRFLAGSCEVGRNHLTISINNNHWPLMILNTVTFTCGVHFDSIIIICQLTCIELSTFISVACILDVEWTRASGTIHTHTHILSACLSCNWFFFRLDRKYIQIMWNCVRAGKQRNNKQIIRLRHRKHSTQCYTHFILYCGVLIDELPISTG